jgi:hypothetical protein
MEHSTVENGSRRAIDLERVQGLDQPTLGRRPAGKEHVRASVKQDQDRNVRDATA